MRACETILIADIWNDNHNNHDAGLICEVVSINATYVKASAVDMMVFQSPLITLQLVAMVVLYNEMCYVASFLEQSRVAKNTTSHKVCRRTCN